MKSVVRVALLAPAALLVLAACAQGDSLEPDASSSPSSPSSLSPSELDNVEGVMPEVPVLPDAPTGNPADESSDSDAG